MQTRTTKLSVVSKGKKHKDAYTASWRFEAWENGVSLSTTPVIDEIISHEFFKYPAESILDYVEQQGRIGAFLKERVEELLDIYLDEKDMTANEKRLDDAAADLKTTIDASYSGR